MRFFGNLISAILFALILSAPAVAEYGDSYHSYPANYRLVHPVMPSTRRNTTASLGTRLPGLREPLRTARQMVARADPDIPRAEMVAPVASARPVARAATAGQRSAQATVGPVERAVPVSQEATADTPTPNGSGGRGGDGGSADASGLGGKGGDGGHGAGNGNGGDGGHGGPGAEGGMGGHAGNTGRRGG
jgi:hypothetical protein